MTYPPAILTPREWLRQMQSFRAPLSSRLLAFYSDLFGGAITTDPACMMIPADDHLPQRGDGVFESLKCLNGQLYNARAHIERLFRSSEGIGMAPHRTADEVLDILCATIRAGGQRTCLIRALLSRGTGNMGIDPALCDGPRLYVMVYRYTARAEFGELKPARAGLSRVPMKPPELATIKTCNYLPNVLMKLEANQRDLDFVISLDQNGHLGEGATENIGIVTPDRKLLMPNPGYILTGTTARRAMELAHTLVDDGTLCAAEHQDIMPDQVATASEVLIFGTTTDVTPVGNWEGKQVGNECPGPIAQHLFALLHADMSPESETLTEVFV